MRRFIGGVLFLGVAALAIACWRMSARVEILADYDVDAFWRLSRLAATGRSRLDLPVEQRESRYQPNTFFVFDADIGMPPSIGDVRIEGATMLTAKLVLMPMERESTYISKYKFRGTPGERTEIVISGRKHKALLWPGVDHSTTPIFQTMRGKGLNLQNPYKGELKWLILTSSNKEPPVEISSPYVYREDYFGEEGWIGSVIGFSKDTGTVRVRLKLSDPDTSISLTKEINETRL